MNNTGTALVGAGLNLFMVGAVVAFILIRKTSLETHNWTAFGVHAGLLAALLGIFFATQKGGRFKYAVQGLTTEAAGAGDAPEGIPGVKTGLRTVGRLRAWWLMVGFVAITAVAHLVYATDGLGTGWYSGMVARENQYGRWVEYAISAPIMILLVALMSRCTEVTGWVGLAVATACTMPCGDIVEKVLAGIKSGDAAPGMYAVAVLATCIGWGLQTWVAGSVTGNFMSALNGAKKAGKTVPWWVYLVIFPSIAAFLSFGALQVYHLVKYESIEYGGVEKRYLAASFLAKAFLATWTTIGMLQQTKD